MLISEIYHKTPHVISSSTTIKQAVEKFVKDKINGLIIVDKNKKVVGVLSLQDVAAATVPSQFRKNIRMAAAMYRQGFFTDMCQQIMNKPVTEIMRKEFTAVGLDDNIMFVTADFLKNDLYIVPVVEKGKLLGVVTRSEIKKALLYGMRDL